ncbi:MAG: hypothetical protein RL198_758 [Actinomycetota bacterium]
MTDLSGIWWLVALLVINGYFVGAEFAVISARRSQIEPLANRGNPAAKVTIKAMERVSLMLATAQLGITVASLLILVVSEPAIQKLLEDPLAAIGVPKAAIYTVAFIIALLLVTYLHVVLGEMLPKNLAIAIPTRAALALVPLLYLLAQLVRPIVGGLNAVSNVILKLLSFKPVDEANTAFTLEQVAGIVSESRREGKLADAAGTITKTIEFTEKRVCDIAVPVDQLVTLAESATSAELQQAVATYGFSRYPVSNANGEISGYWHIKDSLTENGKDEPGSQQKRIRPMISVAETAELEDALAQLRRSGAHIARSFDSAGNLTGCLFFEDIIEELVGEIEDATRRS